MNFWLWFDLWFWQLFDLSWRIKNITWIKINWSTQKLIFFLLSLPFL